MSQLFCVRTVVTSNKQTKQRTLKSVHRQSYISCCDISQSRVEEWRALKLVFQLKQVLSQRYGGHSSHGNFFLSITGFFTRAFQRLMDLKGSRKRWAAGHEPADSVGSPSTPPLGSEPGGSLVVQDSGQVLEDVQQSSSAFSNDTVQYIPQHMVNRLEFQLHFLCCDPLRGRRCCGSRDLWRQNFQQGKFQSEI